MSDRIRRLLDDLRLAGMREAFDQQALSHAFASLGFDDRLENLLVGEQSHRLDRQLSVVRTFGADRGVD